MPTDDALYNTTRVIHSAFHPFGVYKWVVIVGDNGGGDHYMAHRVAYGWLVVGQSVNRIKSPTITKSPFATKPWFTCCGLFMARLNVWWRECWHQSGLVGYVSIHVCFSVWVVLQTEKIHLLFLTKMSNNCTFINPNSLWTSHMKNELQYE